MDMGTHVGYSLSKVFIVRLVLAQEPEQHAGIHAREWHLTYPLAMERAKFCRRVCIQVMVQYRVEIGCWAGRVREILVR